MSDDITIPITRPSSTLVQPVVSNVVTKQETKYPTEIIDLPSGGYFYAADNPLSSGQVEVKMMTAKEEDILTNQNYIKNGVVLDRLLESVLINRKINPNDFFVGDKNAVFMALRRLAYGDSYGPVSIRCPSCKENNTNVEINLGEIKFKENDFSSFARNVNSFEYELPFSKHKITFKLLTSKDENDVDAEVKSSLKAKLTSNELTARLRASITSVDGNVDKLFIRKFIENEMPSKDSYELRKYIRTINPNIDLTFEFTCSKCDAIERVAVPMTAQFFWPDATG